MIIKGTKELKNPTQNPCKNRPKNKVIDDGKIINRYEIIAKISTTIKLYLRLYLLIIWLENIAPNKAPNEIHPEKKPYAFYTDIFILNI